MGQDIVCITATTVTESKPLVMAAPRHPANASRTGNKLPARSPFRN